ncbi:MAG: acyltransferase [Pseudomonadales bacterium]|nr:acyltransferase [Pseudomonadales bacterium]
MRVIKGVAAIIWLLGNAAMVWIPLAFWLIQTTWSTGEKLSALRKRMDLIIWWWSANNARLIRLFNLTEVTVNWHDKDAVSLDEWYLVISNHQSWTDIILLQCHLYPALPPLKFFTKEQLIWVPFIGLAMKALGFPYVKRATKEQIKANPSLRTADRDNTLLACERFKSHPTSVLNFVEGTRRTEEKWRRQKSDFKYLLRPKVGGLDYVLEGLDDHLSSLVDVTIIYPKGVPTFWEFLQGKCPQVKMDIKPRSIPTAIRGEVAQNRRSELAQWIKSIWVEKDVQVSNAMKTS